MDDAESADVNTEEAPVDTTSDNTEAPQAIASEVEVIEEGPCRKRLKIEISLEKVEDYN